ncbi:S8 family peptidase [Bacillaceae bacterium SIJ1]|uniref:S8 family peptidase n=1 Tax=Litoribacterium kuwaitense TaxID=1398745 RepID=UPI0013ED256D|nr:S8 family peptidase [Litoribacterium kuwaitense]NGP46488.1 S8 family peptidase [Litoribacterium kuwaitense]
MPNVGLHPFTIQEVLRRRPSEVPVNIQAIGAPDWWKQGFTGKQVVIAVFDTGCMSNHPDLRGAVIGGRNFTSEGRPDQWYDAHGHGTHVAGIIGARRNERGVVGVAPDVQLLIIKVLNRDGHGTYEQLLAGMDYALKWRGPRGERVRVFNLSLAGAEDDASLQEAVKRAVSENVLVVCAAGNAGDGSLRTDEVGYPGVYPDVVQVGAVDQNRQLAQFSNTNDEIDMLAPGVEVLSTYTEGGHARLSGTSMSAPHVSGAAALLIQKYELGLQRSIVEAEVFALLIKHAESLGLDPRAEGYGVLMLGKSKQGASSSRRPTQRQPQPARLSSQGTVGGGYVVSQAAIGAGEEKS